jgi:hypothetical protein
MKSFQASARIAASPETIWKILTDAGAYSHWNPTVERVEGIISKDEKITVHAKISPGRAFPLKVSVFEPGVRMVWSGGMPLGLFVGERTFSLQPQPGGEVEFRMREEFRGLMAPLITKSIPDLQPSFDEFAAALRRRAEMDS